MDRSAPQFWVKTTKEGSTKGVRVGVDVDVSITQFAFEDSEKAHKLAFELDNFDLSQFESPTFTQGDLIQFSFGYDGTMSPPREAVVTRSFGAHKAHHSKTVSLKASHGKSEGGVRLKIEAIGKEYLMNKVLKSRTFENKKRSDVAKQIAEENGYGPSEQDIEDTSVVLSQITQARMSDYQFLRDLANREGYQVYTDASGFHFHRRKLGQKPAKTLTYYIDGTGTIISFSIETSGVAKPGAVNAVGRDPLKKKDINERGDNDTTAGRKTLASVLEVVDEKTGETSLATRKATEVTVATTALTKEDAARHAKGAYQNAQTAAVFLKLHCVGDPLLQAKSIIMVQGIGSMYAGRYYVVTAKHNIGNGTYTTDLECRRDGTNGAGSGSGHAKPKPQSAGSQNTQNPSGDGDLVPVEVVGETNGVTRVEWRKK